jgi:hypothetical protein
VYAGILVQRLALQVSAFLASFCPLLFKDNLTFMECCWTFLWNVTDESPINCQQVSRDQGFRR